jgi:hypothetical protein
MTIHTSNLHKLIGLDVIYLFKVTGRDVLDVHLAYPNVAIRNCFSYQCNITKGIVRGNGEIVPVRIIFSNFGDVVITDLVRNISTATPTVVGPAVSAETHSRNC